MTAARSQKREVPHGTIDVPMALALEIEVLATGLAARTGEPIGAARRVVEVAVLKRGIEAMKAERAG